MSDRGRAAAGGAFTGLVALYVFSVAFQQGQLVGVCSVAGAIGVGCLTVAAFLSTPGFARWVSLIVAVATVGLFVWGVTVLVLAADEATAWDTDRQIFLVGAAAVVAGTGGAVLFALRAWIGRMQSGISAAVTLLALLVCVSGFLLIASSVMFYPGPLVPVDIAAPERTAEPPVVSDSGTAVPTSIDGSWSPVSDVEGVSRVDVPEGEAAVELVVEPAQIRRGEQSQLHLVNRGDVDLMSGLGFGVERWDGEGWVEVPWPDGLEWGDIGIGLPSGGSTASEMMEAWPWQRHDRPSATHAVEPAWYRLSKFAWYEVRKPEVPTFIWCRALPCS